MASSVDAKLIRRTKFPPEFNKKVDMTKVNIEVMKKWIASQISKILGNEDDVVIELCFAHLEGPRYPDIKSLQIQLTGFLDKDTPKFCQELWSLCLSGQANPQGVPKELLEAKKLELIQEKVILEAEKASEALRRQREQDQNRERELDDEEVVIVAIAVAVEVVDETSTDDLRPPETKTAAETDSVNLHRDVTSTPTCRLATVAAAGHPDLHTALVLHLDPQSHRHHLAETATSHATGDANAAPVPQATQYLPSDASAEEPEDAAVRITVTVLNQDPFPAAVPRAHVPPEETAAEKAPSLAAAVYPLRLVTPGARQTPPSPSLPRDLTAHLDAMPAAILVASAAVAAAAAAPTVLVHVIVKDTDGKRRRSLERYNPDEKRRKMADENEDSTRPPLKADDPSKADDSETKVAEQTKKPVSGWIHSTEFREKLLRERCIAMRRRSSEKPSSASQPKQD
ncbi:Splicing factor PWI [Penicillium italicum]|uniref:Splicing factor PWI n=1 Tax=Penicillium italicum TaxID=40296 RepID=A0A0A2KTZ2_PENIT|nr:Splicing factor PWI [Penicillium italicum]